MPVICMLNKQNSLMKEPYVSFDKKYKMIMEKLHGSKIELPVGNGKQGQLSYLLDNVTQNPYEKIRCWSETRVINCFDYIFRNMDKKIAREKMKMMMNDVSGDEFFKKLNEIIDLRIAEFERLDKEHHKKNEKKGKGDKDKRKISQEDNVEDT